MDLEFHRGCNHSGWPWTLTHCLFCSDFHKQGPVTRALLVGQCNGEARSASTHTSDTTCVCFPPTTTNPLTFWTPPGCPTMQFSSDPDYPELAQTPQVKGSVQCSCFWLLEWLTELRPTLYMLLVVYYKKYYKGDKWPARWRCTQGELWKGAEHGSSCPCGVGCPTWKYVHQPGSPPNSV